MAQHKVDAWGWSTLSQLVMFLGSAWCGAVLSQVFFESGSVRLCTTLVMVGPLVDWVLGQWGMGGPLPRVRRSLLLQGAGTAVFLVVLLGCAALAAMGHVELSPEGRWKRVAAVLALPGVVFELRRIVRSLRMLGDPAPTEL